MGLYLPEGIFFLITMATQQEGYQPRSEDQVSTILLWDVDWKETKDLCHLGYGSDSESAHLAKIFHFTAVKAEAQRGE